MAINTRQNQREQKQTMNQTLKYVCLVVVWLVLLKVLMKTMFVTATPSPHHHPRRKAMLLETLRQAQIVDPESVLLVESRQKERSEEKQDKSNGAQLLGEAIHEYILNKPDDVSIDLLSICRLQCRIEYVQRQHESNPSLSLQDVEQQVHKLQQRSNVEMFELTQTTGIASPNVTIAFGSDPKAKNQDFMNWCHRLLTSHYFIGDGENDADEHLESFRQDMVLSNPYWKAAVKATYLNAMLKEEASKDDELPLFDDIINDPKLFVAAIRSLVSLG